MSREVGVLVVLSEVTPERCGNNFGVGGSATGCLRDQRLSRDRRQSIRDCNSQQSRERVLAFLQGNKKKQAKKQLRLGLVSFGIEMRHGSQAERRADQGVLCCVSVGGGRRRYQMQRPSNASMPWMPDCTAHIRYRHNMCRALWKHERHRMQSGTCPYLSTYLSS